MPYDVLVVDDQAMPRQLFERIVEDAQGYQLVAAIDSASVADVWCAARHIDLVIMDVVMADGVSGIQATEKIKRSYPKVKVLVVTSMPDAAFLEQARRAGVDSFWYKEVEDVPLVEVMDRTMAGERVWPDAPPAVSLGLSRTDELTAREMDVLREVAEGYTDHEVSERLGMSYHTVRVHVNSLLAKTGCATRTELAIRAVRSGIIVPNM